MSKNNFSGKVFAFYLPQFHPCKANDDFWGENFTDWDTTLSAIPRYPGHKQPVHSTELGKYDLTKEEIIEKQSQMAKVNGVDGFAIYHYWFDKGERALEKPINTFRKLDTLPTEYFISWVNADWTKSWIGEADVVIRKQQYNIELYDEIIEDALEHFKSPNYLKIDGKPVFYIHNGMIFNSEEFMDLFYSRATSVGWKGICWVTPEVHTNDGIKDKFDYVLGYPPGDLESKELRFYSALRKLCMGFGSNLLKLPFLFKLMRTTNYSRYVKKYCKFLTKKVRNDRYIPTLMHSWDNTPRYKEKGFQYVNATPEHNYELYKTGFRLAQRANKPLVLIKAWNEWAEGNTLEPNSEFGNGRLNALKKARYED